MEVLKIPHLQGEKNFEGLKNSLPSPGLAEDFGQKPPSFDLSSLSVTGEGWGLGGEGACTCFVFLFGEGIPIMEMPR